MEDQKDSKSKYSYSWLSAGSYYYAYDSSSSGCANKTIPSATPAHR